MLRLSSAYLAASDPTAATTVLANAVGVCEVSAAVDERLWSLHCAGEAWTRPAVDDASRIIRCGRRTAEHLRRRAYARLLAGEPGLAAQDFRRVLWIAPDDLDARMGLVLITGRSCGIRAT